MKKNNSKGITLISLTVSIIILLIIASITTYAGISTIKSSRIEKFKTELEIMEAEVNLLYEKHKDEENINIGKDISESGKLAQAQEAFEAVGVSDTSGYKFFDTETMSSLGIEGVEDEYLVNIKEKEVINLKGIEVEGNICYNLQQITGKEQIKGSIEKDEVTFNVKSEPISKNNWKITVSDIKYSKYVGKGMLQYKLNTKSTWTTVESELKKDSYEFNITKSGTYTIKITDASGISCTKEITL